MPSQRCSRPRSSACDDEAGSTIKADTHTSRVTLSVMKRALRGVLVLALAAPISVALAVGQPGTAHACSCVYPTDGTQAEQQLADFSKGDGVVFSGIPVDVRQNGYTVYYDFEIREVFRGDVGSETTVSTADNSAACGTSFDLKEEYLVFATTYDTKSAPWSVNMCSATTLSTNELTRAAAVTQFGEPRTITVAEGTEADNATTSARAVWIGGGAVAVLAAAVSGWLLLRRRH